MQKLLLAESVHDVEFLLNQNREQFLNLSQNEKIKFLDITYQKFREQSLQIPDFGKVFVNSVNGVVGPGSLPILASVARGLGYENKTNVIRKLEDNLCYAINDIGLLDLAKINILLNSTTPSINTLISRRCQMLIESISAQSGPNENLEKIENLVKNLPEYLFIIRLLHFYCPLMHRPAAAKTLKNILYKQVQGHFPYYDSLSGIVLLIQYILYYHLLD